MPAKRTAGISRRAAKPGFFPQKALSSHLCARGKRNCHRQFRRRGLGCMVVPRLADLGLSRPIAARYLWGILFMPYLVEIGRPTPGMLSVNWQRQPKAGGRKAQDCGRERACNLAPKAQPVAPGEERGIHLSRPPDGGKKAFLVPFGA